MANNITWRSETSPDQSSALGFFREGSRQVEKGLTGLSGLANKVAGEMDSDQLNSALNQINQLGSVDDTRTARTEGLVDTLGLNDRQQIQARSALDAQEANQGNLLQAQQGFDKNQLKIEEDGTRNLVAEATANKDWGKVKELNKTLSSGGFDQIQANQAKRTSDTQIAKDNLAGEIITGTAARNQGFQKNQAITSQIFEQAPFLRDNVDIGSDGRIIFGANVGQSIKDRIGAGVKKLGGYSDLQSFDDIERTAKANASPLVGTENLIAAGSNVSSLANQDSIVKKQQRESNAYASFGKNEAALKRDQIKRDFAYVVPQSISTQKGAAEVAEEYLDLAMTEDTWLEIGKGDFELFSTAVQDAVQRAGTDIDATSIRKALTASQAVMEARGTGGNLGDWNDNINVQKLADKIKAIDTDFKTKNGVARKAIDKADMEYIQKLFALESK
jgi:hypothetical protein